MIKCEIFRRHVETIVDEEIDRRRHTAQLAKEVVVEDGRGNRREQTHGGGDQRLGDARRHDREARGAGASDALERIDDADDGAEQADERRRASRGRQEGQAPLETQTLP